MTNNLIMNTADIPTSWKSYSCILSLCDTSGFLDDGRSRPTSRRSGQRVGSAAVHLQHARSSEERRGWAVPFADDAGYYWASFDVISVISVVQGQCPCWQLNFDLRLTRLQYSN